MRKFVAIALAVLVQGAILTGPLVHAHPDDHETAHHSGRTVHAHWTGHTRSHHSSAGPVLGADAHDRAIFLGAFVAVAASAVPASAVVQDVFHVPVPAEREAHRGVAVAHGHDPPAGTILPSRAPPALQS